VSTGSPEQLHRVALRLQVGENGAEAVRTEPNMARWWGRQTATRGGAAPSVACEEGVIRAHYSMELLNEVIWEQNAHRRR
jgi:hypothetical protein